MDKETDEIGFYEWESVREIIPIGKTIWDKGVEDGIYPRKRKLGVGRRVGWQKRDIHRLVDFICQHGKPPSPGFW